MISTGRVPKKAVAQRSRFGAERKLISALVGFRSCPQTGPRTPRVHCDAANTFRARAISIPAVDYTIFRNAPVTVDILLPVGILRRPLAGAFRPRYALWRF